jgi:hypothetical protein
LKRWHAEVYFPDLKRVMDEIIEGRMDCIVKEVGIKVLIAT